MIVRIATFDDLDALTEHGIRQMKEVGFNSLPAHPFPKSHEWNRQETFERLKTGMNTPIGESNWCRHFILVKDNRIVGHINLKNNLGASLHRAQLGMGIEEEARGIGAGKLLMTEMLKWARSQDFLEYIDLMVFAHNLPARKLYTSFGFTELYTVTDLFRVDGVIIDDVRMVLKLK